MDDYKICIEAFIRWEQLTGRSFQQINFDEPTDLYKLLYCAWLINNPYASTFEAFNTALHANGRALKRAISALSRYNAVTAQFATIQHSESATPDDTPDEPIYLGDAVARLVIMSGMNAQYVMRDMTIEDMMRYVRALDDKQKQESEASRLWTYLSILPHIDGKKVDTPQKLITFAWEVETIRAEATRLAEANKEEFERFMRGE